MKRLYFKCKFLSDVILNAQTANEGTPLTLDYIPGSNFLGLVAANYNDFGSELAYDIFHSGNVRFGDAHLTDGEEKSFKAPLSWFINKGDHIRDRKWLHHALSEEQRMNLLRQSVQLKQVRNGWLTYQGKQIEAEKNFAIKSAYDREKRRNSDGQLFGYKSLTSGLEWIFTVDIMDDKIDDNSLIDVLRDKKSIGRSRSAQYGRIQIDYIKTREQFSVTSGKAFKIADKNYISIYADSRLAFFDKFGQPTLQPVASQFGFDQWKIEWSLCQVTSQIFAPWNRQTNNRLADRVCFDKGSVFILSPLPENKDCKIPSYKGCVGEYKSEGFGQILLNSFFLEFNEQGESTFPVCRSLKNMNLPLDFVISNNKSDKMLKSWISIRETEELTTDFHSENRGSYDEA